MTGDLVDLGALGATRVPHPQPGDHQGHRGVRGRNIMRRAKAIRKPVDRRARSLRPLPAEQRRTR